MQRKAVVIVTGVVLLVSLGSIWLRVGRSTLKLNHAQFQGIGEVVAEETSRAVRDQGAIVAVINASYEAAGSAQYDSWQGFRNELKKHPNIRLVATERVETDPADGAAPVGCPSGAFKKLMEQYSNADAIVFFISLPDWLWVKQNNLIPQNTPGKVIVLDTGSLPSQGQYAGYFANGLLSLLIGPRRSPPPVQTAAHPTPRAWFDKYFQIFTSENYELPVE